MGSTVERDAVTDVERLCRQVDGWQQGPLAVEPLGGGITNRNFLVTATDGRWVVRLPGDRTELLGINRRHEAAALSHAAERGLTPPIRGTLPVVGTLITRFVEGGHLSGQAFVDALPCVVDLMRAWHTSGTIDGSFAIHRVVEAHARDARQHHVEPPAAYDVLAEASLRIERAFAAFPEAPVPCHNDLLPGNVLVEPSGTAWLLDFEYAGMNDRSFDLANLSVNAGLDSLADITLLTVYFGASPSDRQRARFELMKVMSEFREGMWAVVQQAISTLETDFVTYADERLQHACVLINDDSFELHLAAATAP